MGVQNDLDNMMKYGIGENVTLNVPSAGATVSALIVNYCFDGNYLVWIPDQIGSNNVRTNATMVKVKEDYLSKWS